MSDLVQRLRASIGNGLIDGFGIRKGKPLYNSLQLEAADEIDRLTATAEAGRIQEVVIGNLRAEIDRLTETERQFVALQDSLRNKEQQREIDRLTREIERMQGVFDNAVIVVATVERLRAALEHAIGLLRQQFADDSVWQMYWEKSKEAAPMREALTSVREATAEGVLRGEK